MIVSIYGDRNGTQDSIAWWLCEEEGIGPQIYNAPWRSGKIQAQFENPLLGTLVEDIRTYDEHDETMRLMENVPGDFLTPWYKFSEWNNILIWSNYFGAMCEPSQTVPGDRVILANADALEDCFHYVISHAFKLLTAKKVDDDSEVWWQDHVFVGGEDLGVWKELWYGRYHKQALRDFSDKKLKYMWQLNFMHWDLYHAIQNGREEIEMIPADNLDRLFQEKLQNDYGSIEQTIKTNPNALVVNTPFWYDADNILDYLEISWTNSLRNNILDYSKVYRQKRDWFDKTYEVLISKYANT